MDSPHPRGWTLVVVLSVDRDRGFPAPAGMDPPVPTSRRVDRWIPRTRGDGPVEDALPAGFYMDSPHPRGWTREGVARTEGGVGFPAPAGMDRGPAAARRAGGGFPAPAGMDRRRPP